MSRRRGHGGEHHAEQHADERWLVSYADMITVLMCLFLVLFAMSSIDANKYAQLKDSLATGFGTTPSTNVDSAVGVIVEPEYVSEEGIGFTSDTSDQSPLEEAKDEVATYESIIEQIDQALTAQGLQGTVEYQVDGKGLTIKLVGGQTFFAPNQASLLPDARAAVSAIASAITTLPQEISVEGFADPTPPGPPFATNWELAAARSTAVLRFLVESNGIADTRISSVSYGSSRATPGDLAQNRRVDIVLHSGLDADAAALVPSVVDGTAGTAPADPASPTLADTGGTTVSTEGQAATGVVPTGPRIRVTGGHTTGGTTGSTDTGTTDSGTSHTGGTGH